MIVQDGAAYGRVEAALVVDFIGVGDVLIVVRRGQVDHFSGASAAESGKRFHFPSSASGAFVNILRERRPLALRPGFALVR
jgi:hypothetical protein